MAIKTDLKEEKPIQQVNRPTAHSIPISSASLPHTLLIEDDRCALFYLEAIVSQLGCTVTSAVDGQEGLRLINSNQFDLIITDIQLPHLSGIELCQHIRRWEPLHSRKPIPIMGLTGYLTEELEYYCLLAGMNNVFAKPIAKETLQKMVTQVIG